MKINKQLKCVNKAKELINSIKAGEAVLQLQTIHEQDSF